MGPFSSEFSAFVDFFDNQKNVLSKKLTFLSNGRDGQGVRAFSSEFSAFLDFFFIDHQKMF
jgi:hypothetical protein